MAVAGKMTLETATALLAQGTTQFGPGETVEVDLAGVGEVDSSGLAVLFAWQRAAQTGGSSLRIHNSPRNLISLAEVYGVSGLLPLA
jgi:phospholipid transport system transporter-binding protein